MTDRQMDGWTLNCPQPGYASELISSQLKTCLEVDILIYFQNELFLTDYATKLEPGFFLINRMKISLSITELLQMNNYTGCPKNTFFGFRPWEGQI